MLRGANAGIAAGTNLGVRGPETILKGIRNAATSAGSVPYSMTIDGFRFEAQGDAAQTASTWAWMWLYGGPTLDRPLEDYAFVDVATVDGTAVAGTDYMAVSKTVLFSPMATVREVWVWVLPGSAGKTFTLQASNPVHVTIGDGSGTGSIT